MKIQTLNLAAFGPFTERVIALDGAAFHIIYGPNEAGKSSALRGLRSLLYGIEEQTQDSFLHENKKLRIGGCLQNDHGHELTFIRRKGRKNTLLTADGEVLDDQVLMPFLQGVTEELFKTLFGIDHQALVMGGQEILKQKGEVGNTLFSAAIGSHALNTVLIQLAEEAKQLFLPKGSKPTINANIKLHKDLQREIKISSLQSREWDEHRRALLRITTELEKIQSELASSRIEANRLRRIQRVLPKFARRQELIQAKISLGDVITVGEDFADRRREVENGFEKAQAIISTAMLRLKTQQKKLESLTVNQLLLDQAEYVEKLHARLGSHKKALQDRPHIEAESQQYMADAAAILNEIRPDLTLDEIEVLHPLLKRRQTIAEQGGKSAVLESRVEQTMSDLRKAEKRLKVLLKEHDQLSQPASSAALHRVIRVARKSGDLDGLIQSTQSELTSTQKSCEEELSRLSLWHGEMEAISRLAPPARESINQFEAAYDDIKNQKQRLEEKQQELMDALHEVALGLDEIQLVGMVPTEADLMNARAERDQIWQLLRRQWIDREEISEVSHTFQNEEALPDAFENRMKQSDELSDRLRRESDRVQKLATLQAHKRAIIHQTDEMTGRLETIRAKRDALDADWQELWTCCQIIPRTPREMRAWLEHFEKLQDRSKHLSLLRQKMDELKQNRKWHIQQLNQALLDLGEKRATSEMLETVIIECEHLVQQIDESKRKWESLQKEINSLQAEVASLRDEHRLAGDALNVWKTQWGYLMQQFGLQIDSTPLEVDIHIEKVRTLIAKLSEAEKLHRRIHAIDEDASAFRGQVESLVAKISPELADLPSDDAVTYLTSLLSENRVRQRERRQLKEHIAQAKQEIENAHADELTLTERLDRLCDEAKCEHHNQLQEAERKSAEYLQLKAAIESTEREILEVGEGQPLKMLERDTEGVDPDILAGRVKMLSSLIEDQLEPRRTELAEAKGREEKNLELLVGSDQAAQLAEQAQGLLATIRKDAEHYVQVKLASKILYDQIERYRQENQGPLVKCASDHFSLLTLGAFKGLTTEFNEKDEPLLAGIRADDRRVSVEGMSTGTRDQLYLSLRLAALEKYMQSKESIPFIVDDVLIDFDDARTAAALKAFIKLSEKTQVILFTHHSQVVNQAKQLQGAVELHEL
ncbi:MAG: AAA family ATPase [Candidatus Thiodiazotropha sp.]|jgi:uncharacterized protein YhaN